VNSFQIGLAVDVRIGGTVGTMTRDWSNAPRSGNSSATAFLAKLWALK
jgi:hypothetical protein